MAKDEAAAADRRATDDPGPVRQPSPTRRSVLKGAGAVAAAGLLQAPFIRPARAARSLRVATYGGNFENCFIKYMYPEFEKATGIHVDSVSEPGTTQFLMQIEESNRAGMAPIDLCTSAQENVVRGSNAKVWRPLDTKRIPHVDKLHSRYIHEGPGGVDAIGAMAWYMTLIVKPGSLKPQPTSWSVLWDKSHPDSWGVSSTGSSPLFEIAAKLYFGGNAVLGSEDGIRQVVAKIGEIKPNVEVWWESEGTMQTAYENEEVIGGMYFNDVAHVMARGGVPVVSIFPKEGGVLDFGSWCQPAASTKTEEAAEFINYMIQPEVQARMSRKVGTAPLVDRKLTDLTDAEFALVSSDVPPIVADIPNVLKFLAFRDAQFTRMLTS